jgi:chromosome segregation ATPase
LAEARTKRTELEAELIKVKADLAVAIAKQAADTVKLDHLRRRVAELEAELAAAEAKLAELERRTAPPK